MIWFEAVITLSIGAFVGLVFGAKFGSWFTRMELQSKPYQQVRQDYDTMLQLAKDAVCEARKWHDRAMAKEVRANSDGILDAEIIE